MKIFLYGISDARDQYRVVRYSFINTEEEPLTIRDLVYQAEMLQVRNPSVKHVYAIDQRHGLAQDYRTAFKKNSIESWAIFRDILEKEGLLII